MYHKPTGKRRKNLGTQKPNVIPILDAVFIFIFFLLMSANFLKVFEINSDVPIISSGPPPKKDKEPLALTMRLLETEIEFLTGVPSKTLKKYQFSSYQEIPIEEMRNFLIELKEKHLDEDSITFEPIYDIEYEHIVKLMDMVRDLLKTDPSLYRKDAQGFDEKIEKLFPNIVFGNIQS